MMMRELNHLHTEALRLLTIYNEYKDSNDEFMRRKAHLDLDRFLMENRETAAILLVEGLHRTIHEEAAKQQRQAAPWYKRIIGGGVNVNS